MKKYIAAFFVCVAALVIAGLLLQNQTDIDRSSGEQDTKKAERITTENKEESRESETGISQVSEDKSEETEAEVAEEPEELQKTTEPVTEERTEKASERKTQPANRTPVSVAEVQAQRNTADSINVSWTNEMDGCVSRYVVQKRKAMRNENAVEWTEVARVDAGLAEQTDGQYMITDVLASDQPVRYEYRVQVEVKDEKQYEPQDGGSVLASNIMICIDPGHYAGKNEVTGSESYGYAEGDFTLKVATALKSDLKEIYGIDSYMTRTTGTITLGGYTNLSLDRAHISLRGEYAAERDSTLFLSIHTNANEENANGYDTCLQPVSINKSLVFVNMVAKKSDTILSVSNAIGTGLTRVNYDMGLSTVGEFRTATADTVLEWTKAYNDSLNTGGTVVCRTDGKEDYYGVLRGASSVGISGLIVEHGMHTIPEVRKAALGDLAEQWADADAYGIAYGFGFAGEK